MMFRWTNKHPGIQKFWNLCGRYQNIWLPLNKWSGLPFILIQQSMGGKMSKINLVICLFSLPWSTWWYFWGAIFFSGLHGYTLSKTLITCRDMQLRFFKVKTLLNIAFKHILVRLNPVSLFSSTNVFKRLCDSTYVIPIILWTKVSQDGLYVDIFLMIHPQKLPNASVVCVLLWFDVLMPILA